MERHRNAVGCPFFNITFTDWINHINVCKALLLSWLLSSHLRVLFSRKNINQFHLNSPLSFSCSQLLPFFKCVWVQSERTARCTLINIKLFPSLLKNVRHSHTSCTLLQNNSHQGHIKVCPRLCSPSSSSLSASTCKKIFNCCAERCAREQPADHRNDKWQADSQLKLLLCPIWAICAYWDFILQ